MPYRPTPLQNIKKALKSSKALIARIEAELSDERTDKAERSRLLVSLAKLTKDVRSLENKRAKLSAQARGKMPLINRLIGLQNLEHVMRGDGCLLACYSYHNRSIRVEIPDSKNQMSMPRYPAFVSSRDAAERQARQIQGASLQDALDKQSKTEPEQIDISKVAAILGKHSGKHICDEGCRLFGCSIQDALKDAVKAELPEAETESEPAPVEASVDINTQPLEPVPVATGHNTPSPTSGDALATNTLRDNPSDAEVSKWLKDITPKGITITPDDNLEGETLQYWTDKAAVTVKRMRQLYLGFSCTLSFEAGMQFDNFQRQLIPMLGKILYHDPEAVKLIVGDDAKILLGNNAVYDKPVIDAPTQMRFMTLTRKENR